MTLQAKTYREGVAEAARVHAQLLAEAAALPWSLEDEPEPEPDKPEFNAAAFFDAIRQSPFGGSLTQGQVDGVNLIGTTCYTTQLDPIIEQSAYVLATVFHETARTMQPIEEYGGASRHYAPWYGRGHVQLTWEENYRRQQTKLGSVPEVVESGIPYQVHDDWNNALHPQVSALVCVWGMRDGDFTGKKLSDYIRPGSVDYVNARRIVNGTDRAEQIAGYARDFEHAIRLGLE